MSIFSQAVLASPELKGNPSELKSFLYPSKKSVHISGFAEEEAYADKAIVNLILKNKNKLMSQAMEENSQRRNQVKRELVQSGIAEGNINNSKFSQSPQYGWFGKKPDAYEVVNRLSIEISQEDHLKKIAKIADDNSDISLGKISFKHSKEEDFNNKVKLKALENVKKKKLQYEEVLGLKLKPIGIDNVKTFSNATDGAQLVEEVIVLGIRASSEKKPKSHALMRRDEVASFEEIKYKASIVIEYEVSQ